MVSQAPTEQFAARPTFVLAEQTTADVGYAVIYVQIYGVWRKVSVNFTKH